MRIRDYFTEAERRALGAIVVVSLVASGVTYIRKVNPEWFLGEPTLIAESKPPLTSTEEADVPSEPAGSSPATSETPAPTSAPSVAPPSTPPSERTAKSEAPNPQVVLDPTRPIDLNTADATTLELLPGVGPVLAERIIAYRREIGGFRTVDDLLDVKGIGAKTMTKIRPFVIVTP
jgi:competence protein ComEA